MKERKKVLAIIPARYGSKGVKFKNLKKINNISLVERSIILLKKIKDITTIAVSTDSKEIQTIAKKYGVWCNKLRPKKISGDNSYTNEAIQHVLKNINPRYDYVAEMHPTHPFRKKKTIEKGLKTIFNNKSLESVISVQKVLSTSHPDYIISEVNKKFYFKKSASLFNRNKLKKNAYAVNAYLIITKLDNFKKYKKMIDNRNNNYYLEIPSLIENLDINNSYDLEVAQFLSKKLRI